VDITVGISPGICVDGGCLVSGPHNTVNNAGTITSGVGTNNSAIFNSAGYLVVTNNTGGVIVGNISPEWPG
jgi:hypothetical protein